MTGLQEAVQNLVQWWCKNRCSRLPHRFAWKVKKRRKPLHYKGLCQLVR